MRVYGFLGGSVPDLGCVGSKNSLRVAGGWVEVWENGAGLDVAEEFVEVCPWEVASWACGWGEVFVEEDLVFGDVEALCEGGDDVGEVSDLFVGEWFAVAIADEADFDGV